MKLDEISVFWCMDVKTVIRVGETDDVELVTMYYDESKKSFVEEVRMTIPSQRFEDIIGAMRLMFNSRDEAQPKVNP